jgi:hypothetical protein
MGQDDDGLGGSVPVPVVRLYWYVPYCCQDVTHKKCQPNSSLLIYHTLECVVYSVCVGQQTTTTNQFQAALRKTYTVQYRSS